MEVKFGILLSHLEAGGTGKYDPKDIPGGKVFGWRVKTGDSIKKGDVLTEVDLDKVTLEIPSPSDGTIVSLHYEGDEEWFPGGVEDTPFGKLIIPELGVIQVADATAQPEDKRPPTSPKTHPQPAHLAKENKKRSEGRIRIGPEASKVMKELGVSQGDVLAWLPADKTRLTANDVREFAEAGRKAMPEQVTAQTQIPAVPAARARAREKEIELTNVRPSHGQVVRLSDIEEYVKQETMPAQEGQLPLCSPIETSTLRKTVAHLMEKGWKNIPQAGDGREIDITKLVEFRTKIKERWEKEQGMTLRYEHFFAYALVRLMAQESFAVLNSFWDEESTSIMQFNAVNMGIAVHTERGLTLPVLHNAQTMNFDTFVRAYDELVERTLKGQTRLPDFRDATCIFNNVGAKGGEDPYPVIPYVTESSGRERPITLLLAIARAKQQADGRHVMKVVARFDHRVIDGAPALEFLLAFQDQFESVVDPIEFAALFR